MGSCHPTTRSTTATIITTMGCCLNTTTTTTSTSTTTTTSTSTETSTTNPTTTTTTTTTTETSTTNPDVSPNGGAPPVPPPPPPPLEEETVKEGLSETPIPKPPVPIANDSNKKRNQQQQPVVGEVKIQPKALIKPAEEIVSEVSEVSEMCSFSESSSTTVTEKREDDGEVTQRVQRSLAKVLTKRPFSSDLPGGKGKGVRYMAGRSNSSQVKRTQVKSRSVQGRTTTTTPRNVGPPKTLGRDSGKCSGRRSRSPVRSGEAGPRRPVRSKSPPLTQAGRSGGRTQAATAESGDETEKPSENVWPEETTQSLENPLVSLE